MLSRQVFDASVDASPARDVSGSGGGHVTSDRKPVYQHIMSSREEAPSASRPQTLTSSSLTPDAAAHAPGTCSWSTFSGCTFPRRAVGAGPGRRRVADVGRPGRATPPRSHSRSYSDLLSDDPLSPPPPPPPLEPSEPRGSAPETGRTPASSGAPRAGPRRRDSWTLDRHHRSTVAPACTNPPVGDVTAHACVVDCRLTGHPVCDV